MTRDPSARPPRANSRTAFTLVEVLAVVLLTGLLASLAFVSLGGLVASARVDDAAASLAAYDRLTREAARRFDRPTRLVFDLETARVARRPADPVRDGEPPAPLLLPAPLAMERVVVAGRRYDSGEVAVDCSAAGHTPSYAVMLRGTGGQRTWVFVAGLTGQSRRLEDDEAVDEVIQLRSSAAPSTGGDDVD